MKKSILLTLALAGMASAAPTYTLDTAIVKPEAAGSPAVFTSAYEAALGQTSANATAVEGIGTAGGLSFSDDNNMPTVTLTLSNMYGTAAIPGNTLELSSLSFLSRADTRDFNYSSVTVSLTKADGSTKSVTSTAHTLTIPSSNNAYLAVTWTFDDTLVFSKSDTLTLTVTRATDYTAPSGTSGNAFGMGAFTADTGYSFEGSSEIYSSGNTHYFNFFRLEVIPEPTTATLSLLALAGLAARRRRR